MSQPANTDPTNAPIDRSGTVLETDESIRQALLAAATARQQTVLEEPRPMLAPAPSLARSASPFRPSLRPPVPMLTVCDDGKADGEVIRIRCPRFVIGRAEGDLCLPLDGRISAKHVEITHQVVGGLHRWVITDLQSTHGMFVRVSRTVLADKAEFLVGNGRYRFDGLQVDPAATGAFAAKDAGHGQTRGWDDETIPVRPAALTELIGSEIGNRVLLVKSEYWIGSEPSCAIGRPDDPFCEPRHARLYRGAKGGWAAEHDKTLNGLWLRMSQIVVEGVVHFQIGEQRFRLKVS